MQYSLLLPREIIFGWGTRSRVGELAQGLGSRVFLITGGCSLKENGHLGEIVANLEAAGLAVIHFSGPSREPTIQDVDDLCGKMREELARTGDVVAGVGGGSVLDLAKAAAAMVTNANGRSVREFLEGVGTGASITVDPLPLIAMPTTAGTGTEATKNAVISVDDPPCKKSLRSPQMVPAVALVDPELTVSCPRDVTAASGMDAITQLIESYVSRRANRFTRAICLDGLRGKDRGGNCLFDLEQVTVDATQRQSRESMAYAALMSGIALANSGLGFAHGVAAALGAYCNVTHGLACATLLPHMLRVNLEAIDRFDFYDLGFILSATDLDHGHLIPQPDRMPAAIADCIQSFSEKLGIPSRLRDLNVPLDLLPQIAAGSMGNSMSGNPREMTVPEVLKVLQEIW